ncbi:hypothetical protein [Actinokineospora bangkokensis]|uniref:Uncharacterized protein n=1 Tax=Actinokineospora bangkokensis TaxID=1193682 RepID=A0A1Q9LP53_9PSEU|nr:hypothetical protein [Actinokineospora bangkokensis]OLR93826.1 hypothetical protein BJP25_16500 [Actinokineospora bangkokensis]
MSTSPRPDPHETHPAHPPGSVDEVVEHLRGAFAATPELDYLAHFRAGTLHHALDRLGEPAPGPDHLPGSTRRDAVERLGRHVTSTVRAMDRRLQQARTGRLVRTAVSTDRNALFCDTIRPGDDVIGVMPVAAGPAAVAAGDRAVAALATRLRALDGLPAPNYGSFDTTAVPADPGESPTRPITRPGTDATAITDLLRAHVGPDTLHLLTYWADDHPITTVDCLDDPTVLALCDPDGLTATERRAYYTDLGADLGPRANELNRAAAGALGGRLLRLVLDVEGGAVFYRRLPARRYLVGVTLDQRRVGAADDRVAGLAADLSLLPE